MKLRLQVIRDMAFRKASVAGLLRGVGRVSSMRALRHTYLVTSGIRPTSD